MGILLGALGVTPFVLSYLAVVRWADRLDPKPWWVIGVVFLWGAMFATLGGGTLAGLAEQLLPSSPGLRSFIGAVVFAPVFEELFKGLGVVLLLAVRLARPRLFDGPLDGVIYGGVIGLGFTLTEDILYVANHFQRYGLGAAFWLLFLRTVLLGLSHCTFTACTGLGFGIALDTRRPWLKVLAPISGFCAAMAFHAMRNFLPHFGEGATALMIVLSWGIVFVFFVLLAGLVVRDRHILVRELSSEYGQLIAPTELKAITRYFGRLPRSRDRAQARLETAKRRDLVELASVKRRLRLGSQQRGVLERAQALRARILELDRRGVRLDGRRGPGGVRPL